MATASSRPGYRRRNPRQIAWLILALAAASSLLVVYDSAAARAPLRASRRSLLSASDAAVVVPSYSAGEKARARAARPRAVCGALRRR